MAITDIFWFFFLLSALQPMMTRRLLEFSRQRLISKIENDRGSRVILLVHRQETMSFLGFPVYRYIDVDDSEEVLLAIHMTGKDVPDYIEVNHQKMTAKLIRIPQITDVPYPVMMEPHLVVEYYSR